MPEELEMNTGGNVMASEEEVSEQNKESSVADKIKKIVCKELKVEESQVTNGAKFMEDLGADSLDIVELVMAIEAAFDLDIPDEEAENIRTVGDAIDFVKKMEKV